MGLWGRQPQEMDAAMWNVDKYNTMQLTGLWLTYKELSCFFAQHWAMCHISLLVLT